MADRRELLNDPEEAMRLALENWQSKMWTAGPGLIESYDPDAQTVSVQLTTRGSVSDEAGNTAAQDMPLLVDVPVVFPRAGGFAITFPVIPGDECLVVFGSRCIDGWWQSGGVQSPLEDRMHDLSDAFAILGPTSQPRVLADVQTDGVEMRTEDRSTYLKLTAGTIFIKGNIVHEGDVTQTGNLTTQGTVMGTVVKTTSGTGLDTHDHGSGALISGKTPAPNSN